MLQFPIFSLNKKTTAAQEQYSTPEEHFDNQIKNILNKNIIILKLFFLSAEFGAVGNLGTSTGCISLA